jgi:pimeloyl-ACP methyl ester carboxylesterase
MLATMHSITEHRVELGGWETRALEINRGGTPTLLFFHGWADSADTFRPLMAALADTGAHLLAVDLPNYGEADDLAAGAQLPQYERFVSAALLHWGQHGMVLPIGQSLGGRCLLMALNRPGAATANELPPIAQAVVIGPAPLQPPPWQKMLLRNQTLLASVSRLGGDASDNGLAEFVASFRRTCFANTAAVADSVWCDYARHYTPERVARHHASLHALAHELAQPLRLDAVKPHIELIWGELDRMAPVSGAKDYVQALPDCRLSVVTGCGHHAHIERVDEVADLIRSALPQLSSL